jgi:hypothetical protein
MMANTGLLEAWVSSSKANSILGKVNMIIRVGLGLPELS